MTATSTLNVGDDVYVGLGTSPATITSLLPNDYAEIKWRDKVFEKNEGVYPLAQLKLMESRRLRSKPASSEKEQSASAKKMKKDHGIKSNTSKDLAEPSKEPFTKTVSPETAPTPERSASLTSIDDSNVKVEAESAFLAKPKTTHDVPDLWEVTGVDKDKGLDEIAKLLPEGLKKCKQDVAHFFLFCFERQMVWERRNRGEWEPYTENVAMQEYFFCNNYRELDRGTNYFRAYILDLWDKCNKNGQVSHLKWIELVLWASTCYRLVNRISTFEDFGCIPEMSDGTRFQSFIKKASMNNKKVFTDAHMTGGMKLFLNAMTGLCKGNGSQVQKVSREILECLQNNHLEGCFEAVKNIHGVGDFSAWQVVCDLMESQCLKPCGENDWTQLGPGAKKGISIIFANGDQKQYSSLQLARLLQEIQCGVYSALGIQFPLWNNVPLTLKNIEHPLCEFQKYIEIHNKLRKYQSVSGQRRVKSRSQMDCDKACHYVTSCGVTEDILLCDKCLVGFCEGCVQRDSTSAYWVCPRCTAFEAVSFA